MPSGHRDAIASLFQPRVGRQRRPRVAVGGGGLLFAAGAALEPLDDGAAWAALFGASLEEAPGDRVAYPAALACASLPSHELKVLEPSGSFNSLRGRRVIASVNLRMDARRQDPRSVHCGSRLPRRR